MLTPRGTFRSIKRGCTLHTLIQELKDSSFSGYCKSTSGSSSITIVFDKGTIRLAEYDTLKGDDALKKLTRSGPVTVNAILHDLSPTQLDLALEFNPLSVVRSSRKTRGNPLWVTVPERKKIPSDLHEEGAVTEQQRSRNNRNSDRAKDPSNMQSRPDHTTTKPAENTSAKAEAPHADASPLSRDLEVVETMDIESMATKFRADARAMMKRLELDHVIDPDIRNDSG
jgi:hypothetical protein